MKLNKYIDRRPIVEVQSARTITIASNFRVISLSNFCNSKIVRSLSLKVLKINI